MTPDQWGAAAATVIVGLGVAVVALKNAGEGVAWVVRWAAAPALAEQARTHAGELATVRADVATLRGEVAAVREEVAELRGAAAPLMGSVERLYRRLEGL